MPPFTTFYGLFDRSLSFGGKAPWNLPPRWLEKRRRLDLSVPLNFVCTADIIGGSSGSPVLDKDGEVVGLVFDGNIESMAWDYFYTDEQARAVAVDSARRARGPAPPLRRPGAGEGAGRTLT